MQNKQQREHKEMTPMTFYLRRWKSHRLAIFMPTIHTMGLFQLKIYCVTLSLMTATVISYAQFKQNVYVKFNRFQYVCEMSAYT